MRLVARPLVSYLLFWMEVGKPYGMHHVYHPLIIGIVKRGGMGSYAATFVTKRVSPMLLSSVW